MDYNGVLILTTYRLAQVFKCSEEKLIWNYLKHKSQFVEGVHFYHLNSKELKNYEERYPQEFDDFMSPYLWTFEGVYKHADLFIGVEAYRAFMSLVYYFSRTEELKNAIRLVEKVQKQIENIYIFNLCEKKVDQ